MTGIISDNHDCITNNCHPSPSQLTIINIVMMQERLFIGTPGSYYWQGQGYSMNLLNRYYRDCDAGDADDAGYRHRYNHKC